jgi:hypothetical protein
MAEFMRSPRKPTTAGWHGWGAVVMPRRMYGWNRRWLGWREVQWECKESLRFHRDPKQGRSFTKIPYTVRYAFTSMVV